MNVPPPELLVLLAPLLLIQAGLIVAALWDLTRPGRRVRGDSRAVWALVILLANTIGPILYFVVGRQEAGAGDEGVAAAPTAGATPGWTPPDATRDSARPADEGRPAPTGGGPTISCRGLRKRYDGAGGILALEGLDLEIPGGSVFGLLGPNGAGKTTTLRILDGLIHASAGAASVAGA